MYGPLMQCPECHSETQDHPLAKTTELAMLCKNCRRAFRKDMAQYEQADEFCPHCDNHYVIEAKTPQLMLSVEGEDGRVDPSIMRDDRAPTLLQQTNDGAKIDHGGYQAAALAFQRKVAQGRAAPSSSHGMMVPQLMDFQDEDLDWD